MLYQFFQFRPIGMFLSLVFLISTSNLHAQELYKPNACNRSTQKKLKRISTVLPFHKKAQMLTVEMDDGRAFLEGDIAINHTPTNRFINGAVAIASKNYRWTEGIIPYTIARNHPKRNDILSAIDYISANTNICLTPRSGDRDYVQFVRYSLGCWSYVGRQGGMQEINIGNCDFGAIVHEICHAIGMFHEQSRSDRDQYISINWNHIEPSQHQNFEKHVYSGIDIGPYDYHSIMHYPAWAFSNTGGQTISCEGRHGCPSTMGQRDRLSSGDLQAIRYLYKDAVGCGNGNYQPTKPTYPKRPTTTTNPKPNREIVVAITDALGEGQYAENINLNIGGANTQFNLSLNNQQQTIEFVFPESGWYTYSIQAKTTFYKSFWGWKYTYDRSGSGQGKIYVDRNKNYYLAMKENNNNRGAYTAYLQEQP